MSENRPGLGLRVWTRTTLLARLTIAGLAAALGLSMLFGYVVANHEERVAVDKEKTRAEKSAREALLAIDRDPIFAPVSSATVVQRRDELTSQDKAFLAAKLQSVADLLSIDRIALLRDDGSVLVANETAKDWDPQRDSQVFKEIFKEGATVANGKHSVRVGADTIEAFHRNEEKELIEGGASPNRQADVRAIMNARAAKVASIVLVRKLADLGAEVGALRNKTLLEAFGASVALLVIILVIVRREVAGQVVLLSQIVAHLARTGELAQARTGLAGFGVNGDHDPQDRNELRALVGGFDALLASHERLATQANAIARDDLWNECFDKEAETRGDLAISFRKMVSMLRDLSIRVGRIARGDLTVPASAPGQKEGSLGSAFREMTEKLKLLLDELAGAGAKIDKAARGLQESSRDQASTATEQAAAVTETMATMEELAASSGHIADTAKHVVQLADETLASARGGQASVTDVGTGMEEIVAASRQGAHRLLDLGEKSRAIGKVAELITGIAERSKILALNAAIEAARAGEAGRGFSVVADEVRSLADHVVESTREIEGLIGQIQSEISAAVLASEEEVKRAEKGRELATKAQASLQAITDTASKTTDAARQIELATNQQRSASGQVATAVREVATSSEEVATGAKRVTVSANELAALAHDLQAVINQFDAAEEGTKKPSGSSARITGKTASKAPTQPQISQFDAEALRRG